MGIKYNNTSATIVKYNNTELDKVIYNTTTVYQRITVNYYCENSVYKSTKVISGNRVDLSSNNAASKSGWTFIGWRTDKTASSSVQSSITASTVNINLYAVYRQTVTVSYNGNGATGGSTAAQTGYRYYNNTNIVNPSFTLRSNGFSRTNYKFVNWRQGSTSGTARNPGTSLTLSSNTTFYAAWEASWVTSTFTIDKGQTQIDSTQGIYIFPTFSYSFSTTGNCLSRGVPGQIKALCNCNVSFTLRLWCSNVDAQSVAFAIYLYKNGSLYNTLQSKIECMEYRDLMFGFSGKPFYGTTIRLNTGDTLDIRVQVFQSSGSNKARVNFRTKSETDGTNVGVCRFTAVPI